MSYFFKKCHGQQGNELIDATYSFIIIHALYASLSNMLNISTRVAVLYQVVLVNDSNWDENPSLSDMAIKFDVMGLCSLAMVVVALPLAALTALPFFVTSQSHHLRCSTSFSIDFASWKLPVKVENGGHKIAGCYNITVVSQL